VKADISSSNFTVFPNFSGLGGLANIRIWHPKGQNKFEIWSYTIVERNAPEEIKEMQQRASLLTEGAAGMVEIDDGENWNLIGETLSNSTQSRRFLWNYQMGLGHESENDPTYPGKIAPTYFGEGPQRGFYRRYRVHDERSVACRFPEKFRCQMHNTRPQITDGQPGQSDWRRAADHEKRSSLTGVGPQLC
jgi:Ring hydroxylating alpha subunit (catalytic domain)